MKPPLLMVEDVFKTESWDLFLCHIHCLETAPGIMGDRGLFLSRGDVLLKTSWQKDKQARWMKARVLQSAIWSFDFFMTSIAQGTESFLALNPFSHYRIAFATYLSDVFLKWININKQRYQRQFLDFCVDLSGHSSNSGCWNILTACSLQEEKAFSTALQHSAELKALMKVIKAAGQDVACTASSAAEELQSRPGDGKERSTLLDLRLQ